MAWTATMTPSLGPQCLSCKRRRVKCDSAEPGCKRCEKDSITCPGYIHVRQWKPSTSSRKRKKARCTPTDSSEGGGSDESQIATPVSATAIVTTDGSDDDSTAVYFPSWRPQPDKDTTLVIDAIQYFNTFLIPSVVPAHRPFRRDEQQLPYLHDMPSLVKHTLIATIRMTRAKFSDMDSSTDAETCHYKGLVLAGLRTHIGRREISSAVLTSIISMINFELQMSSFGAWTYHLEAARSAITVQGGFSRCVAELLWARSPLITYAFVDVLGATTSHSRDLNFELIEFQAQYMDFFARNEQCLLIHGRPCPGQILQAMIATNILRANSENHKKGLPDQNMYSTEFSAILDIIERFEPITWADTVAVAGQALPLRPEARPASAHIDGWVSLAFCFQQAALLYLCLSCTPDDAHDTLQLLRSAKRKLSQHICHLLRISSCDYDAPVETQLWKFLSWPLVISAYARVGWDIGDESTREEIDRLRQTAEIVGIPSSSSLQDAAALLKDVQMKRRERQGRAWRWDDAFELKTVFI